MDADSTYFGIISKRRGGPAGGLARLGLLVASAPYRAAIQARNFYYARWAFPLWLDVPVVSIGNITVGGTGKTPMTLWMCERFLERGRKPAVLSRGYKAERGLADELMLISHRLPQAVAIANPNRFAAGRLAVQEYGAQAAVLDDGFQHRRMGRDLDIVLIDATRPFGFGHLLPRGLLREPLGNLSRAEAIVITRADQVDDSALNVLRAEIQRVNPNVPVVHAVHRPAGWADLQGTKVDLPAGARVGAFAGIARPDAFVKTLESMNHVPAGVQWFPDHHAYSSSELQQLAGWAESERYDALVTTEKDAVKLGQADFNWPLPIRVLRIDMEMLDGGDKILCDLIDTMLKDHEEPHEPASIE